MTLHSKSEIVDYIWSHSRFYHYCLVQCESLYNTEMGFSCVMVLLNCLENISRSVVNDYNSNLYNIFYSLYEKNVITKNEYEFLNNGDFCIRKIRNLYAHKNIAAINFIENDGENEILWPLTENETSLMIYSKISDIVFNLIIKMVSSNFIDSVKKKFQEPLDGAINKCDLRYKIFTAKELLILKGYPEDYISDDLNIPEDAKLRIVDNSPDVNMNMLIYSKLVAKLRKEEIDDKNNNT